MIYRNNSGSAFSGESAGRIANGRDETVSDSPAGSGAAAAIGHFIEARLGDGGMTVADFIAANRGDGTEFDALRAEYTQAAGGHAPNAAPHELPPEGPHPNA